MPDRQTATSAAGPDPECQELIRAVEANARRVRELLAGLSEAQFNWRPAPRRWSFAQNLEHMNIIYRRQVPRLEAAVARGRARRCFGRGPFRYGWVARLFARQADPDFVKLKLPTPPRFKPPADMYGAVDQVAAEFLGFHDRMLRAIDQADGLDLARVKGPVAGVPLIRIPLGSLVRYLESHTRRHVRQVENLLGRPDFPDQR